MAVDGRERGDEVGGPAGSQLEQLAVVDDAADDVAHVVAAGGRRGQDGAGLWCRAVGGVGGSGTRAAARRCSPAARPAAPRWRARRRRASSTSRLATPWHGRGCRRRRAPSVRHGHAGELLHHVRAADEGVGVPRHHDVVGEPEQQRRARDGRAGHHDEHGHDARALHDGPGRGAPAVQRGDALVDVGPARREEDHQGHALVRGRGGPHGRRIRRRVAESAPWRTLASISHSTTSRPAMMVTARAMTTPGTPAREGIAACGGQWGHRHVRPRAVAASVTAAVGVVGQAGAGWMPGWFGPSRSTRPRRTSRNARAGADSMPRRKRRQTDRTSGQPVDRHALPVAADPDGAALAGSNAAPNPWNASVASKRMPSTSAWDSSSMPASAHWRSS